jgi:fructose-1,6-bisphosphatase II / sedoheptulose-1,7-bisphosphatase
MSDHNRQVHVDRNLALELVRVTEAAALAASRWMGKGDKNAADGAAVEAMRKAFDTVAISGTVVIGEGEMDEAPMLYIGEKVGLYSRAGGGPEVDIAVDPLEGTTLTAKGGPNAMAVVALAQKGGFLHAPDIYMEKLAVGPDLPHGVVSLDASVEENLRELAKAKRRDVSDLVVCLLDRDRHKEIVKRCRAAGARIMMIPDGDVSGVVAVSQPETGVDIYMGSGGAPEGVLAAAALRCIGGQMQGRLLFENDDQILRAKEMGVTDPNRIYGLEDMAKGEVMFAATGVTTGPMLRGRAPFRLGRGDAFHRHAQQVRHGALRGGPPQLRAEAFGLQGVTGTAPSPSGRHARRPDKPSPAWAGEGWVRVGCATAGTLARERPRASAFASDAPLTQPSPPVGGRGLSWRVQ